MSDTPWFGDEVVDAMTYREIPWCMDCVELDRRCDACKEWIRQFLDALTPYVRAVVDEANGVAEWKYKQLDAGWDALCRQQRERAEKAESQAEQARAEALEQAAKMADNRSAFNLAKEIRALAAPKEI